MDPIRLVDIDIRCKSARGSVPHECDLQVRMRIPALEAVFQNETLKRLVQNVRSRLEVL
jgi:hypothetical protein